MKHRPVFRPLVVAAGAAALFLPGLVPAASAQAVPPPGRKADRPPERKAARRFRRPFSLRSLWEPWAWDLSDPLAAPVRPSASSGEEPSSAFTLAAPLAAPQPEAAGQTLQVDTANGNSPYAVTSSDTWSSVKVGYSNTGVINHSAGTFTVTDQLDLGNNSGSQGTYNLSGSGILNADTIYIALNPNTTGTFNQTGGTVSITYNNSALYVGGASTGTYNLGAGSLNAPQIYVGGGGGYSGTGVFNQTGGTVTINGGPLYLAYTGSSSSAIYTLGGGTLTTSSIAGTTYVPHSTFNFAGGTLRASASDGALYQASPFFYQVNLLAVQGNGGAIFDTQGFSDTIPLVLQHDPTSGAPAVDGGLTKLGAGTLTLSAANTFTGPTTASAGTLDLDNALALQDSTLTPGAGTIAFDSRISGGAFTVGGLGGSANLALQNNAATPAAITLNVGNGNASASYGGVLSGGGALHKVGTGTQTLSGANTYTGGTFVDAGTLAAAHAATGNGGVGTFAGGSTVTINGGGTLLLTGTNSLGTGSGNASLNINGGVVTTDGTSYTTVNSVTMTGGTLTANGPGDSTYGAYYFLGPVATNASSATATFNSSNGGNLSLIGSVTFNVAQGTTSNGVDLLASGSLIGSGALVKNGAGTLDLANYNSYTGGTTINAGTLIAGQTARYNGGTGTFANGSTVTVNSGGTLLLAGGDSLGFYSGKAVGNVVVNGGTVTTDGSANHTTIDQVTMTGGTLTANGPGDSTAGTFYLNGPINTQASAATATINASNNGYVSLIGSDGAGGSVTFNVAKGTTASGVDLLISAPLVNNTPLVKSGTGTLALSGANTYSGATSVNAGTLLAQNISGSATGTGAMGVAGTGSLLGGTGTVSGAVTVGNGAGVLGGNGVAATGALTLSGALTLNSGSFIELVLGANGAHSTLARTGSGAWSFAANQAFTFINAYAAAQTGFYDNIITGLSADPGGESSWTITGGQFRGSFAYDGSGDIDLTLTAVPEPATWLGGALIGLLGVGAWRRQTRRA